METLTPLLDSVADDALVHALPLLSDALLDRGFGTVCRPGSASQTMTRGNFVGC